MQVVKAEDYEIMRHGFDRWDEFIVDMANELKDRSGVKRMSYDTWWWDERKEQEAEEYVTYFYLKHGK